MTGASGLKYHDLSSSGPKFDVVRSAIEELRRRLVDDEDCERWLAEGSNGGYATPSLLGRLGQFTRVARRIEKDGQNAPGIAATANDLPGIAIVVNGEGAFFYGGAGPSLNDRIFILTHELAHVTGAPGFIQDDGDDQGGSEAQARSNSLLRDKCKKTLGN